MDNSYEIIKVQWLGREIPAIVIRRKPSDIPVSIDMFISRTCGMVDMDGPNNIVKYIFSMEHALPASLKYLRSRGWEEKNMRSEAAPNSKSLLKEQDYAKL